MDENMKKTIIITVVGAIIFCAIVIFAYTKIDWNMVKEISTEYDASSGKIKQTVVLQVDKENPYREGDKWVTPYNIMSETGTIVSGNVQSDDIVAPSTSYIKDDDLVLIFRGAGHLLEKGEDK